MSEVETAKPDLGRPTTYTEDLANEICGLVGEGENLNVISQRENMPSHSTLYKWLGVHKDFADKYARARVMRADARSDRIDDVKRRVLAGAVPPDVARVVIDAEKWQAGKEAPKRYGEKIDHTLSDPDGKPISFTMKIDGRKPDAD